MPRSVTAGGGAAISASALLESRIMRKRITTSVYVLRWMGLLGGLGNLPASCAEAETELHGGSY